MTSLTWTQWTRSKIITFVVFMAAVVFTAVACTGGNQAAEAGIAPEKVTDYLFTVLSADRTAYTRHVVGRLTVLEGVENENGVVNAEATEFWEENNGVPLPAQMFRLGAELGSEGGELTYGLISTWYINDAHAPKGEFEENGIKEVEATAEPYKGYQEIGGQKYFSAMYPDVAVAPACVSCHNAHPVHQERYPDKIFELDEVMGAVVINLPIADS